MTYKVAVDTEAAYEYVNKFFPVVRVADQRGIVQYRNDEVVAAALYVEFNGSNVFVHLAGSPDKRWLTRDFLYWGFHYPFVQLGCRRITCCVDVTNVTSRIFCEHIGLKPEAVLEAAGVGGVDVIVYKMFREDCKYV